MFQKYMTHTSQNCQGYKNWRKSVKQLQYSSDQGD